MKHLLAITWKRLGSIHLTVALCLLLILDLCWGYACLRRHAGLFSPLNDLGLHAWAVTYGRHNLAQTAWFFVLLALLALFAVNTFVCTTDRVAKLLGNRKRFSPTALAFRLAPHVMHYALLMILVGYLASYLFAEVLPGRTLVPGATMELPGGAGEVTLTEVRPLHYEGKRLDFFTGRVIRPEAHLLFTRGDLRKTAILTDIRPAGFGGWRLFMRNFAPKKRGGMGMRVRVDLTVRKDPGVVFYLAGMVLFTAGLALYVYEKLFYRNTRKEVL